MVNKNKVFSLFGLFLFWYGMFLGNILPTPSMSLNEMMTFMFKALGLVGVLIGIVGDMIDLEMKK